jgi:hypothetical protein
MTTNRPVILPLIFAALEDVGSVEWYPIAEDQFQP